MKKKILLIVVLLALGTACTTTKSILSEPAEKIRDKRFRRI